MPEIMVFWKIVDGHARPIQQYIRSVQFWMKNSTKHFWREKARAPVNVCPFRNRLFCIRSDIHCDHVTINSDKEN